jgi:hypothetical protein
MNWLKVFLHRDMYFIYIVLLFTLSAVVPVLAQSQCPIGATITLPPNYSVNVRSLPDGNSARVGGLNSDSPAQTVLQMAKDAQGRDWYRIGEGRWVIGSFFVCTSPTPTRTPTRTPTVTPRTATASPTRQPTSTATIAGLQTVTPHPTINPFIAYEYGADGKLESATLFCYEPCQWKIVAENLPE